MITCLLYPYSECVITATTIKQAKKMVEEKIEGELIKKLSPVLLYYYQQGLIKISYSDDEVRVDFLFNGSKIIVLPSADSSRGARATVLNYEECRLLKKGVVDSVFEPMGRPRQAKFLSNEKYANDKRWLEQAKSIYITSNRFKSEWFWKTFKDTVEGCYLDKKIRYNFFASDIFLAIHHGIKSEGDLIKAKKSMSDIDFRAEMLNETIGESENSFFSLEMFRKNQVIKNAFYPPTENDIIFDKNNIFSNKKSNEYRFIWVDFAWANSTGRVENDNTIIGCTNCFWNGERFIRNNVYLETHEASDSDGTDLRIRELFYDFSADYLVMD